jgi:haloacetate dehalogenase
MFFDGFDLTSIAVPGGWLRVRIGGTGPALLLVHGTPKTHAMWHAVADRLADRFTVICPDLRGHGGSFKPDAGPDHAPHSARAMAADLIGLMDALGHPTFAIGGHGRGAQVAHRLALEHPERVTRLTVLDSVPERSRPADGDMASSLASYPGLWFFKPLPLDEHVLSLSPRAWFNAHDEGAPRAPDYLHPKALADYLDAARDPRAVVGMTESFRAAGGVDRLEERMLRARGLRIACPTDVLWSARGHLGGWYDPRTTWQDWCVQRVDGEALPCGPHLAEELPDQVAGWLLGSVTQSQAAVA